MAGSYNHIVTNAGNLGSNERVVSMLENGGDVFEAVEEMFGMIWWLAGGPFDEGTGIIGTHPDTVKDAVEEARKNYKKGLEISKRVHRMSPDNLSGDKA